MDINNNTHTNIFTKGMNTDTSDMLLSSELYREARNLRLSTNKDNNSSLLHTIDGTSRVYSPYNYFFQYNLKIIKIDSIRDILVVIAHTTNGNPDTWNVYCTIPTGEWEVHSNNLWRKASANGFSIESLNVDKEPSTVLNYESDNNIYLYIADGEHPIYKVQIDPEKNLNQTDDNIISYYNGDIKKPSAEVSENEVGLLVSGKIQYAYRVYKKHGNVSQMSPVSNLVYLYKDSNSTTQAEKNTTLAVEIETDAFDSEYNIQIYRIHYIINGELPTITLIYDGEYKESYIDRGGDGLSTLSASEFVSIQNSYKIIPRIIQQKDQYLFAANIKEADVNVDNIVKPIENNLDNWFNIEQTLKYGQDGFEVSTTNQCRERCFREGETYRFGLVFYDKNGQKSSVFKLQDKEIINNTNFVTIQHGNEVHVHPIGIDVKLNQNYVHPEDVLWLLDNFSKIEVVRAARNISNYKTITLGIIGNTLGMYSSEDLNILGLLDKRFPSGFISENAFTTNSVVDHSANSYQIISTDDVLQFVSPETVYAQEDTKEIIKNYIDDIKINPVYLYKFSTKIDSGLASPNNAEHNNEHSFCLSRNVNENTNIYHIYNVACMQEMEYTDLYQIHISNLMSLSSIEQLSNRNELYISNVESVTSPEYNTFNDLDNIRVNDDVVAIGNYEFIPWTVGYYEYTDSSTVKKQAYDGVKTQPIGMFYPIATCGKCLLFELKNNAQASQGWANTFLPATLVNIQKTSLPYNDNCAFYSFGDFIDLENNETSVSLTSGDSMILMFEYNAAHAIHSSVYKHVPTMSTVYRIPVYTYVDISSEYGTSYTKQNCDWRILDIPAAFNGYVQTKSCYLHNNVYDDTSLIQIQVDKVEDPAEITKSDARIFASLKKENGEFIDSWLLFKPADFIDLDYKYGEITDMAVFNNHLISWQKDAAGVVSVNERALVNSMDDTHIMLGTADVLSRYDYITAKYGMAKNQMCHTQSATTLYWWDSVRRELLAYSGGLQVVPLTATKGLRNYINKGTNNLAPKLLYDEKYKEVLSNVIGTESLVYSEEILQFTSIYDMYIKQNAIISGDIYLAASDSMIYMIPYTYSALNATMYGNNIYPSVTFIINPNVQYTKVYDNTIIGGSIYGNSVKVLSAMDNTLPIRLGSTDTNEQDLRWQLDKTYHENTFDNVSMCFKTPLNQSAEVTLKDIVTINEYDFRLAVPRSGQTDENDVPYGNRMRGKTMECTIKSSDNSTDFSLQYIITKYRISWS